MQENIGSFGGDSTEVTVFGESAGSASIAYHLLSPLAKGLFKVTLLCGLSPGRSLSSCWQSSTQRAILQSSSALASGWRPLTPEHARRYARLNNIWQNVQIFELSVSRDLLITVCSQPALVAKRMRISSPACRFSVFWVLVLACRFSSSDYSLSGLMPIRAAIPMLMRFQYLSIIYIFIHDLCI